MTLSEKQQAFPALIARLINQAYATGYTVAFGEAWRSPEQAEWNAAHGTGVKNSLHCERLAVDLLLFKAGVWLTHSDEYLPLGEFWESLSTREMPTYWGGRFSDGNHFSVSPDNGKTKMLFLCYNRIRLLKNRFFDKGK